MLCREHQAPLFGQTHARRSAAITGIQAFADLYKYGRPVTVKHDEINFSATAPGRPIIALDQTQSGLLKVTQSLIFCGVARLFGAGCTAHRPELGITLTTAYAKALVAARDAASSQHYPQGALYVVATPIGNLADISLRALHVLDMVDTIACEDTRHTQTLLRAYGIDKPSSRLLAVHQHNEAEAAETVMTRLRQGQRVAYVSDAGTPGISDPGARLVAAVQAATMTVVPLPGASSVTSALSIAGVSGAAGTPEGAFIFLGFLPTKATERTAAVETLAGERRCVVLLEAPHRIEVLASALSVLGSRRITIGRELTKQFEEIATIGSEEFPDWLKAEPNRSRGEFVLVLHPAPVEARPDQDQRVLKLLLAELPLKTAVKLAADITGLPRNTLYQAALTLKKNEN